MPRNPDGLAVTSFRRRSADTPGPHWLSGLPPVAVLIRFKNPRPSVLVGE